MQRLLPLLVLLAAACGNSDNLVVGGVGAGATTPDVVFDNIGSAIHGVATMRDANGNPVGDPAAVIILSDRPNLCNRLRAQRDYFRNPTEAFEALIMVAPIGQSTPACPPASGVRLGTFVVGRSCDEGTQSEIVAVSGKQVPTPFIAEIGSYVAITNWPDGDGNATGSFSMGFDDPYGSGPHVFYGRFKTNLCRDLESTLLP